MWTALAAACGSLLDLDRFESARTSSSTGGSGGDGGNGAGGTGGQSSSPFMFTVLADGLNAPEHLSAGEGVVYFSTLAPGANENEPVMQIETVDLTPTAETMPQTLFDADVGNAMQAPTNREVQAIIAMDIGAAIYRGNHLGEDSLVYVERPGANANTELIDGVRRPILFTRRGSELLGVFEGNGSTAPPEALRWNTTGTGETRCDLPSPPFPFEEPAATSDALFVSRPDRIERVPLGAVFSRDNPCEMVAVFDDATQTSSLRYDAETEHLVWASLVGVYRKHRSDDAATAPVQIATTNVVKDLAVHDGRVYWLTDDDRVFGADIDGELEATELAELSEASSELEANQDGLYVLQTNAGNLLWAPLPTFD